MANKAVFLSRDHTLVVANGAVPSPTNLQLAEDAPDALRRLRQAGYRLVSVSNEPGVARGLFDEEHLELVHNRLKELLAEHDAALDGIYYCPYLDSTDAVVSEYHHDSELRLPRPGMIHQAAGDHSVELGSSWVVGGCEDDIVAGRAAGCRTVLLADLPDGSIANGCRPDFVFSTLEEAAECILASPPPRPEPEAAPEPTEAAAATGETPASPLTNEVVSRLDAILDLLHQQRRAAMHRDFSTPKLLGAVCQMIALGLLLWAWMAMMESRYDQAVARCLSMIAVQLIALTMFVMHQRD